MKPSRKSPARQWTPKVRPRPEVQFRRTCRRQRQPRPCCPWRSSATLLRMTPRSLLPSLVAVFSIATFTPTLAKAPIDFDALTIVDINHAFDSGVADLRKAGAAVPGADPGVRPSGAVDSRGDDAQSEGARHRARARRRAESEGPRSPLHGIPIVLKDNYNTFDMPTTGGSVLLEGSIPPADAFVVKKAARRRRHHSREGEHVRVRLRTARTVRSAASR